MRCKWHFFDVVEWRAIRALAADKIIVIKAADKGSSVLL